MGLILAIVGLFIIYWLFDNYGAKIGIIVQVVWSTGSLWLNGLIQGVSIPFQYYIFALIAYTIAAVISWFIFERTDTFWKFALVYILVSVLIFFVIGAAISSALAPVGVLSAAR